MTAPRKFLFVSAFLFFQISNLSFGATSCAMQGGVCTLCGTYYQCVGGTLANKWYLAAGCSTKNPLTTNCYNQTDLSCVCAGCDTVAVVQAVAGQTCYGPACSGGCGGTPEVPHHWQKIAILFLAAFTLLGWQWRSQRQKSKSPS